MKLEHKKGQGADGAEKKTSKDGGGREHLVYLWTVVWFKKQYWLLRYNDERRKPGQV